MLYDTSPEPGTVTEDQGHGVTVVRRDPPDWPDLPGADWVAPYAVNCAEHGWIVSRRTADKAAGEGRGHLGQAHEDWTARHAREHRAAWDALPEDEQRRRYDAMVAAGSGMAAGALGILP